jgi:hypothetical protein
MHLNASDLASVLESDLAAHGYNGAIAPYPGQPASQYAMMSLKRSIVKKFHNDETDQTRDLKALELFTKVNSACEKFDFSSVRTEAEAIALGEAKSFLYGFFYPNDGQGDQLLTFRKISEGLGLGSGASVGADNGSFYSKVAIGPLTSSNSELLDLYQQAIYFDPTWSHCEKARARGFGHKVVQGSRLSFVPKSSEISRTICTEPVLNMLFQKGIARLIEGRLHQNLGIDLATQPTINRKLCLRGSKSGRFGTIDLSSASDSMSLTLVKEMFPPAVYRWLERTRCDKTILPDGSILDLHMVSSMGNGFTFPLQTAFFSALVYGAYRVHDVPFVVSRGGRIGNFAVFGDDIIVRQKCYNTVVRLLQICGFTVNIDKSFNEGLFRESCGHDYYYGYNVRGVYIQSLRHAGDFYSAINRLNRWSARHRIPLPRAISLLASHVQVLPVPYDESDDAGIKVPLSFLKHRAINQFTGGIMYRYRTVINRPIRPPLGEEHLPSRQLLRRMPSWCYNSDGLMLSLLHGSIRNGSFLLRPFGTEKAVIRKRYSSCWDYINFYPRENRGFSKDWKFLTEFNLLCEQIELS